MNLLNINKLKLTSSIREENLRQCIRRKLDVKKIYYNLVEVKHTIVA